jgi:hypothetical protein
MCGGTPAWHIGLYFYAEALLTQQYICNSARGVCGSMPLVEYVVERADLNAESISIGAALFLLVAVQSFQADTETLCGLPNEVHACVVRLMVGVRFL